MGVSKSQLLAWTFRGTKGDKRTLDLIPTRLRSAEGQALVEYALTVSLLPVVRSLSGLLTPSPATCSVG
jgi:hypothetical protein